ncbi:MAG TPA: hypothetical protein VII94_04200 [Candidatus Saccharimonadales bacterium]
MKLYERCPICDEGFLNDKAYESIGVKRCPSNDHRFIMITKGALVSIVIRINDKLSVTWFFGSASTLYIEVFNSDRNLAPFIGIPFFEPDFSNYPKLIEKIKTYVVFA